MSTLRALALLALAALTFSTTAFAEEGRYEVERLQLRVNELEQSVDSLKGTVQRLETLQRSEEALLKKVVLQLWELQSKADADRKLSSGSQNPR